MRIALSTGGGDAPGLNAVIRAAVLSAVNRGWEVLGVKKGYAGLLGEEEVIPMTASTVRGIAHLGGTILRTTNRGNPFSYPVYLPDGSCVEKDRSDELIENARKLGIDAMISIGGDGSLSIAHELCEKGMRIVCVPKTIDNDVSGTIAEGAHPRGEGHAILGKSMPGQAVRVGGVAERLAEEIERGTKKETRSLILGHLQRGGQPTGYDRLLAVRFGGAAVRAVAEEKWDHMIALQSPHIVTVPLANVLKTPKRVEVDHDTVFTARATGISFGD
jgi:6-phosphofructokinase